MNINKINPLNPFGRMCVSLGMLPSSYKESMTYEEQLLWLFNYLDKTLIPKINEQDETINGVIDLFNQLKEYVDNYFENLDVQDEINHKLDEMVEDGTFDVIFAQVDSKIGDLSSLTTTDTSSIVSAVNEIDSHTDTNTSAIGDLTNLTTTSKTDLVSAINEVDGDVGTLSSLHTTVKTSAVDSINEIYDDNKTTYEICTAMIPAGETTSTWQSSVTQGYTCHNSCVISTFIRDEQTWSQTYSDLSSSPGIKYAITIIDGEPGTNSGIYGTIQATNTDVEDRYYTIIVVIRKFNFRF